MNRILPRGFSGAIAVYKRIQDKKRRALKKSGDLIPLSPGMQNSPINRNHIVTPQQPLHTVTSGLSPAPVQPPPAIKHAQNNLEKFDRSHRSYFGFMFPEDDKVPSTSAVTSTATLPTSSNTCAALRDITHLHQPLQPPQPSSPPPPAFMDISSEFSDSSDSELDESSPLFGINDARLYRAT